ncbi:MAG: sugar ABC transporter ATP-binding protein [Mycobacteriales bacterium]
MPEAPLLAVEAATKAFGGVPALRGASLVVRAGEVVGLLGENGAGKSTLVKALAGINQLDSGRMLLRGTPYSPGGPRDAEAAGIAVIYQEPSLFPDLTIAENIFVGRQPMSGRRVDWSAMRTEALGLFDQLGVRLSPDRTARGLSIADQQLVEIAKALSSKARLIIMDEPTAALSASEVTRLTGIIARLRGAGTGLVFITHRLDEVFEICDRVTIMRDGVTMSDRAVADVTVAGVIRDMVGRDLSDLYPKTSTELGPPILEVENLTYAGTFRDVSLTVHEGEIVALAGLVGAGRSEVVESIFGLRPYTRGSVTFRGRLLKSGDTGSRISRGMAMVPEDRRQQGLFMSASVVQNATITVLDRLRRLFMVSGRAQRAATKDWTARLNIKHASLEAPVQSLSGGNQQKVVLAKWLMTEPNLLIIDEPTRGIDVGTKAEVHRLIGQAIGSGLAVLMVSSELPEVLGVADRIYVMREGRIVEELGRDAATQELIMTAATGAAV